MPGFNLSIGKHKFPTRYIENDRLSCKSIVKKNYILKKFTLKKFEDDKIFIDEEDISLVLEGVILNKNVLQKKGQSWKETVVALYRRNGETFFTVFKGSFSGALYDKTRKKWIIFTDHIGSKHVYYSQRGIDLFFSSEIADIYALFKETGLNYTLDEKGAYMLLSYGYMLEDFTLCREIKKLRPGSYINIEDDILLIKEYYRAPENYIDNINENEILENIDELFRNAISLQFDKDKEYGYKHIVALSGGLDSRMTTWVAHEMGYTNQINFTFSQSGYLDETIAKEIAGDLKHEWIFKALDNGLFLKDIDKINQISGGCALYYGLAHGESALKYINFDKLGALHSGQLGDIIIGSIGNRVSNNVPKPFSRKFLSKATINSSNKYISHEIMNLYQRGLNGANTGLLPTQYYTETYSPFYDVSVLNFCFKIPPKYRMNHNIYKKWIIKKYPNAADYLWESTKSKLTDIHIKIMGKEIPLKQIPKKLLLKSHLITSPLETAYHMNPLNYWYKTNPDLREFQDNYFDENIEKLNDYSELKNDCVSLYYEGNGVEKNQVLTLLSALKLFYS